MHHARTGSASRGATPRSVNATAGSRATVRHVTAIAACVVLTAACGAAQTDDAAASRAPVAGAATPSAPSVDTSAAPSDGGGTRAGGSAAADPTTRPAPDAFPADAMTEPVVSPDFPGGGAGVAHLTRVDAGRHAGFDRVVWQFDGPAPSFRAEYAAGPVTESGSGRTIAVDGAAALTIIFSPASGVDLGGSAPVEIYKGPDRMSGATSGTRNVAEIVETGDFESTLAWAVGVDEVTPFTVSVLPSPPRVVLDVAH